MSTNLSQLRRKELLRVMQQLKDLNRDNFDLYKGVMELELELTKRKFGIVWEEHEERVDAQMRTQIPVFVENKELEISADNTKPINFLLEGDNLHSLYLLEKTHSGRIDTIYIDPPYNTGNKDFVYDDVLIEKEDGYRHSKWISFMEKRLRIAKKLLTKEGVIFISIDDNEYAQLKLLTDEIFGEANYEGTITYVRKTSGKQDSSNFAKSTEYILVYSRSGAWKCNYLEADGRVTKRYNKIDKESGKLYREVDLRKTGSNDRREDRPNLFYPFYYSSETADLFCEKEPLEEIPEGYIEILPIKSDGTEGNWRWELPTATKQIKNLTAHIMPKYKDINKWTIYEKDFIDKKEDVRTVKEHTFWHKKEFNSDNAVTDFTSLGFSNKDFSFPKSVQLLKHILRLSTNENSTILDFFAGSGTLCQAMLELNEEDGGNRKCILCTNNENNICKDITWNRISKVVHGYSFKGKKETILFEKKLLLRDLNNIEKILQEVQDVQGEYKDSYTKISTEFKEGILRVIGQQEISELMPGLGGNLKYYETRFIEKENEDPDYLVLDELPSNIIELLQLEHGIDIESSKFKVILTDDEIDAAKECEAIYLASNVLLTTNQIKLLEDNEIKVVEIPDYYFKNEIKEVG